MCFLILPLKQIDISFRQKKSSLQIEKMFFLISCYFAIFYSQPWSSLVELAFPQSVIDSHVCFMHTGARRVCQILQNQNYRWFEITMWVQASKLGLLQEECILFIVEPCLQPLNISIHVRCLVNRQHAFPFHSILHKEKKLQLSVYAFGPIRDHKIKDSDHETT